jgi:hypothetical protein
MGPLEIAALMFVALFASSLSMLLATRLFLAPTPVSPPAQTQANSAWKAAGVAPSATGSAQKKASPGNVPWPKDLAPNGSVKDGVMRVKFPAGSYSSKDGINEHSTIAPADDVTLSYQVLLEPGWCWGGGSKAGKLMGLWFGESAKKSGGTGGEWSPSSGSLRLIWLDDGEPTAYVYYSKTSNTDASRSDMGDQDPEYSKFTRASGTAGHLSFGGKFAKFKVGSWNDVSLRVKLNTPGKRDGIMSMTVNGKTQTYGKMMWRNGANQKVQGVLFQLFHGGNDKSFSCNKTTYAQVRNVRVT